MDNQQKKDSGVFGIVVEALPNTMFRVKLDTKDTATSDAPVAEKENLLCFLSGKMRLHRIRVLVGDKVFVEIDPYGGKGRITKRF
ncbi:MAG: translation initiation factor IF-1 [Candidatus Taylorbacteria bacterium]|nr:translation initiation factor IF-1 [Candidatus Taylorbacteria bacterium]